MLTADRSRRPSKLRYTLLQFGVHVRPAIFGGREKCNDLLHRLGKVVKEKSRRKRQNECLGEDTLHQQSVSFDAAVKWGVEWKH